MFGFGKKNSHNSFFGNLNRSYSHDLEDQIAQKEAELEQLRSQLASSQNHPSSYETDMLYADQASTASSYGYPTGRGNDSQNISSSDDDNKVVDYFAHQSASYPQYQFTIYEMAPEGIQTSHQPSSITLDIIFILRSNSHYFLEGSALTPNGVIRDLYYGTNPHEIFRKYPGCDDVLDLRFWHRPAHPEPVHRIKKPPRYQVIARDDLADAALEGMTRPRNNH